MVGKSFREALAHPSIYFVAARGDEGEVLGYVVAWFVADEGQIANLAVAPSGWGSGIGRVAARRRAARSGAARGDRGVSRGAGLERARAAIVPSRGFEEVGRRRGYYRRPVEDAIVLRRTLKSGMCEVACEARS